MKRDSLKTLYRQGVVVDVFVIPYSRFYCIEYELNNGGKGLLAGFDKNTPIRKFRTIDAACKVVNGLGIQPVRVFMDGSNDRLITSHHSRLQQRSDINNDAPGAKP